MCPPRLQPTRSQSTPSRAAYLFGAAALAFLALPALICPDALALEPSLLELSLDETETPSPATAPSTDEKASDEKADDADSGKSTGAGWPQYRGPLADGKVAEGKVRKSWPSTGPKELWQIDLGNGFSGISAAGGRLYTQFSDSKSEYLVALDADTGKEIWRLRTGEMRRDRFGDGPRSTPTLDGDRIYAVSAFSHLWCVDKESGEAFWDVDLREKYEAEIPTWGVSASPVVHGDLLIFNVGGKADHALMAFDKKTGDVRWKMGSGIPGYSMPLFFEAGGVRQLVIFAGSRIFAVDPDDGQLLWEKPWETAYDVNAATPLDLGDGRLFVSSGYDTGSTLFQVAKKGEKLEAEVLWTAPQMKNQFSSSIFHDGYIYGFDNKIFKCIDAANGQEMWKKSGFEHGSLVFVDGHFVVLGEKGRIALVEADPKTYREKAAGQVDRGKHWTVPTYYDGRLFIRNEEKLMGFEI